MASELDILLTEGSYGLAAVLDGRESATVPSYRTEEGGPVNRFHPVVNGPLLVLNQSEGTMHVEVGYSDLFELVVMWLTGSGLADSHSLNLEPHQMDVLSPVKTFIGLKVSGGSGVLRSVGSLSRGPSAMPSAIPKLILPEEPH